MFDGKTTLHNVDFAMTNPSQPNQPSASLIVGSTIPCTCQSANGGSVTHNHTPTSPDPKSGNTPNSSGGLPKGNNQNFPPMSQIPKPMTNNAQPPTQPHAMPNANPQIKDLESQIGPRGKTKINSVNRPNVRKWLTENGIPFSAMATTEDGVTQNLGSGHLTMKQLNYVYNDTTDKALNELRSLTKGQEPKPSPSPQTPSENDESDSQTPSEESESESENPDESDSENQTETQTPSEKPEKPTEKPAEKPKKKKTGSSTLKKHKLHDEVMETLQNDIGALVFGPAGSGKTTLAMNIAEDMKIPFRMNGAIFKEHKLFGFIDANGKYHSTPFRDAFENGGLYLFDEVDASNPQVLLTLNSALANGVCDFPDKTLKKHPNFRFMASANTNGNGATAQYSARNPLDGATKDRFMCYESEYDDSLTLSIIKSMVSNPEDLKIALEWNDKVLQIRRICKKQGIDLILSPRASFNGVRCLTNPNRKCFKKVSDLLDALVFKKISNPDSVTRLKNCLNEEDKSATPESSTQKEPTVQ